MTDAEQREERERGGEKRLRLSGGERQKGPRGIRAAGPGRRGKERQRVTGRRGLRAGEVEEGTPAKGRRRKRGVNEGEFECVRQTWTEAIVGSWS